jgi:hypothetical protein
VLHVFPELALEVSVTVPPGQKVVGPFAVIVGEVGEVTLTLIGTEVAEQSLEPTVTV